MRVMFPGNQVDAMLAAGPIRTDYSIRTPLIRLLDELGTQPNIVYIGQEPTQNAKPVTGPTRYEDIGLIEDRRAVLEGPDAWFTRMIRRG